VSGFADLTLFHGRISRGERRVTRSDWSERPRCIRMKFVCALLYGYEFGGECEELIPESDLVSFIN
jgi:hypothetical protein